MRTGERKKTILDLVSAFVSTYSEQRAADVKSHLPVPASFRAMALKLFDKNRSEIEDLRIKLFGLRGRAIQSEPLDAQMADKIDTMARHPTPRAWSGYVGAFGNEILRTIKPVLALKQSCISCHNRRQPAGRSWKLGDVMGAYVIDVPASSFFRQLRWETGFLAGSAFLLIWGSGAFLIRQQAHISTTKAEVLRENERGVMLTAAREQAENEATKLSAQVRKAYEDLRQALEKERKLNALQRQFVSMASHEFRTPLAIIDGTAQRLERRSEKSDPAEIIKRAHKIRNAVERMTTVMESTLSAASLDVGKLTINVEPCDIATHLEQTCQRYMELNDTHKITCNISKLPGTIQADPGSLEQIISNLLSNAIKYAPLAPDIEVKAYSTDDCVVFSVRDYGLGIDEEDLPHVFERFFRARTATGIAGTGIGLNLVKILIELHDGSIELDSTAGEGSLFTVRLPINGPEELATKGHQAA